MRVGSMYAVLFDRALEIYTVESDDPLHKISFDTQQTGFDFISSTSLVVSDDKGRLTLLTRIDKSETIEMKIIETKVQKFRSVTTAGASEDDDFFCTLSKDGLQFWHTKSLLNQAETSKDDMIISLNPERSIKLN